MPPDNETPETARERDSPVAAPSPADSRSEEGEARSDDSPRESEARDNDQTATTDAPPLPDEPVPGTTQTLSSSATDQPDSSSTATAPPLPNEAPPGQQEADDGWSAEWDATHQAWYFYNRFTGVSQWDNPRVPNPTADTSRATVAPATATPSSSSISQLNSVAGGYNPAIHGSWDPNASYAQAYKSPDGDEPQQQELAGLDPLTAGSGGEEGDGAGDGNGLYAQNAAFNRRTGKFQLDEQNPERYSDANKSHRQMNAYFDVDRAANSHDGRSLKAERRGKQPTKKELAQWKEKRKARKEEKRRAWLRD